MATPNASIKITQLADIGANLANTTIFPVVGTGPGGILTTQSTTLGNMANLIFANGLVANSITAQTVTNAAQPNITSVGTLGNLTVSGNALFLNVNAGNSLTAVYLVGDGGNITNIQGNNVIGPVAQSVTAFSIPASNVIGTVANATFAVNSTASNVAVTVSQATQPNITSVGTLSNLTVAGTVGFSGNTGMVGNLTTTGNTDLNGGDIRLDGNVHITVPDYIHMTCPAPQTSTGTPVVAKLPIEINGTVYWIALTATP